jgi:hypothetical protein
MHIYSDYILLLNEACIVWTPFNIQTVELSSFFCLIGIIYYKRMTRERKVVVSSYLMLDVLIEREKSFFSKKEWK